MRGQLGRQKCRSAGVQGHRSGDQSSGAELRVSTNPTTLQLVQHIQTTHTRGKLATSLAHVQEDEKPLHLGEKIQDTL